MFTAEDLRWLWFGSSLVSVVVYCIIGYVAWQRLRVQTLGSGLKSTRQVIKQRVTLYVILLLCSLTDIIAAVLSLFIRQQPLWVLFFLFVGNLIRMIPPVYLWLDDKNVKKQAQEEIDAIRAKRTTK